LSEIWISFLGGVVGTTLLVSAVAKTLDRTPLAPFLVSVGVPPRAARLASAAAVPAEAVVAVLVLGGLLGALSAALAVALTLAFVALQLTSLRRGEGAPCRCFGALDGAERSVVPLGRAVVLALAALALLVGRLETPGGVDVTDVALGALVGVAIIAGFALLGRVDDFNRRRLRAVRGPGRYGDTVEAAAE
jgi:hypothetical protein